jgi:predicted lipid carrier protein YhbT
MSAATPSAYVIPVPLARVLSLMPASPRQFAFVTGLNLLLLRHLPEDVLEALEHRRLRIVVRDAGVDFDFEFAQNRFTALSGHAKPDLCITANAYDFLLLTQKKVDPDTLFFSQRLAMEGDTELGVLVKNTLDAIELPVLDAAMFSPSALLARLRDTLKTHRT